MRGGRRHWVEELRCTVMTSEPVYEYGCPEGNYSMSGMLAGARAAQVAASAKGAQRLLR